MGQISDYMPGIAAGVSTAGNIISQYMSNEANKQLATQANQWSIDQWNRENQYNLPINQVRRLQDAGINPGILYGQGGLMNEAAPSPGVTTARVSPYIMDPLTMAQVANINALTDKTKTETDAIVAELPKKLQDYEQRTKESDARISELNQTVTNLQEQLLNMREDRKLTVEKQISESFNRTLASQEFERKSKETVALVNKLAQDVSESKARESLTYEQKRAVQAARHLDEQQFAFLAQANAYKLLGLQYDNILKQKSAILYDDQHVLNNMQSQLLGFDISNGRVVANRNERWLSEVSSNPISLALDELIGAASLLLTPVKGIISIK